VYTRLTRTTNRERLRCRPEMVPPFHLERSVRLRLRLFCRSNGIQPRQRGLWSCSHRHTCSPCSCICKPERETIRLGYSGVATDTHRRAHSTYPGHGGAWDLHKFEEFGVMSCGVGWDGSGVGEWWLHIPQRTCVLNQCSVFYAAWKYVSSATDCVYRLYLHWLLGLRFQTPYLGFAIYSAGEWNLPDPLCSLYLQTSNLTYAMR